MVTEYWKKQYAWEFLKLIDETHREGFLSVHRSNGHWGPFAEHLLDHGAVIDVSTDPEFYRIRPADGVIIEAHRTPNSMTKPRIKLIIPEGLVTRSPMPEYAGSW